MRTGGISSHFDEIYGASVSKEAISRIADKVLKEMQEWSARPLDEVYAAIFVDAIVVNVRDGQVASRPIYAAIGVSLDGHRDVLGLWAGTGGDGTKFWMSMLTDIRNRGTLDVFFRVCDGLKGLPGVALERVAGDHGPNVCNPFYPQYVSVVVPSALGCAQTRSQADLQCPDRGRREGSVRRPR